MKKIEKINNQIVELREKQSKVYMEAMRVAKETMIEKFFKPQGVYFNMGDNDITVRPELGYTTYHTKAETPFIPFEITFNNNNWNQVKFSNLLEWRAKKEGKFELGVEFNIHSRYGNGDMITNGDNLKQLAFFGLVAQCIEDTKEEMVSKMVDIFMFFENTYNILQEEIRELEMHIRVIKEEEAEKAQKNLIKTLTTTGVDIKEGAHTFEYGYKKSIWAPTHIKITKRSASGKSATIEVESSDFRGMTHTCAYDRVRVENIVDYVTDYQK
tara:strand:+ start:1085 stop:1894 length:810 start_codon:yes stop_codon:yes gene_type:complete